MQTCSYDTRDCRVQTAKGKWPQKTTSSEFAAFFDLVILPKLRSFYLRRNADGSVDYEDYAERCRKFAVEELKLPPRLWSKVHLPAYISLDNAPIHKWARKLSFRPRQSAQALRDMLGPRFRRDFKLPAHFAAQYPVFAKQPDEPARRRDAAVQGKSHPEPRRQQLSREEVEAARAAFRNANIMRNHILEHDAVNDRSWVQDQLHELSLSKPGMICLVPQQWMPLAPVTPDIHCPIEHIVGTVKAFVRDRLLDFDVPDEALQLGATYLGWLEEAVRTKCNGEAGRHHLTRSIHKQNCICQILKTPEGCSVTVEFEFKTSHAKRNRQTKHVVAGTGGAWICNSKWT